MLHKTGLFAFNGYRVTECDNKNIRKNFFMICEKKSDENEKFVS